MFRKIRHYFVSGILILAPFFLTMLFISYLFRLADAFVVNPVFHLLPFDIDAQSRVLLAKLIIAVAVVVFVTTLGIAAEKFIFRKLIEAGESALLTIPVFSRIYRSFKDIALALFGNKSGIFKRVVFIEYPRKGVYSLGFVTLEHRPWELSEKMGKELFSVFLPHAPNPAAGFFVYAPKEELIESNLSVEEGIRLCISGGAAIPAPLPKP